MIINTYFIASVSRDHYGVMMLQLEAEGVLLEDAEKIRKDLMAQNPQVWYVIIHGQMFDPNFLKNDDDNNLDGGPSEE